MVGFAGTSNVEAARRYGLVAAGTMAHSYIEAFPNEIDAFRAFAQDFPERATFLVDTYDTIRGVERAIAVIKELGLRGQLAIRIDSGNLGQLARQIRRLLDRSDLSHVRILASSGAPIDVFAVGTKMGVSADYPYLDTAYKLVCYADRPVMKLSRGKVTAPGRTQVFRRSRPFSDLVALYDEPAPAGRAPVLEPLMTKGRRTGRRPSLTESHARFQADLALLPDSARNLRAPKAPQVRSSPALRRMSDETMRRLIQ